MDTSERKKYPIASGVLDYFPDAIVEIAYVSYVGNEQHNPGQPVHWDRSKSGDEADAMMRHFLERGTVDTDGIPHTAKMAWRALALLQKEIEAADAPEVPDAGVAVAREMVLGPGSKLPDAATGQAGHQAAGDKRADVDDMKAYYRELGEAQARLAARRAAERAAREGGQ